MNPDVRFALLTIGWIAASGAGLFALTSYKSGAGTVGSIPESWPSESALALAEDRPTLVLAAHPRCVCTRATLAELARLASRVSSAVKIHVLFVRPEGMGDDWTKSDLWESAQHIPGATLHEDPGGAEASRFGAETSGQVIVFDPQGRRLFHGGITGARGHEGNNVGLAHAIESVRAGQATGESPVFGCALGEKEARGGAGL